MSKYVPKGAAHTWVAKDGTQNVLNLVTGFVKIALIAGTVFIGTEFGRQIQKNTFKNMSEDVKQLGNMFGNWRRGY